MIIYKWYTFFRIVVIGGGVTWDRPHTLLCRSSCRHCRTPNQINLKKNQSVATRGRAKLVCTSGPQPCRLGPAAERKSWSWSLSKFPFSFFFFPIFEGQSGQSHHTQLGIWALPLFASSLYSLLFKITFLTEKKSSSRLHYMVLKQQWKF